MNEDKLEFGGQEHFAASPDRLFSALTDLGALAKNIPNLESAERLDDRNLKATIRPGFSFLRGTLQTTITLSECDPPRLAVMNIASQGIGAQIAIESRLQIDPADGSGSHLTWSASVTQLRGLIATVSRPLIAAAAKQVIQQGWQQLRKELGE